MKKNLNNITNFIHVWFVLVPVVSLFICFGCGEIIHHKTLIPVATDKWTISTGEYGYETIIVAIHSTNTSRIEVKIVPIANDQVAVGPIIPIFPNFLDDSLYDDNILQVVLIVDPPTPETAINTKNTKIITNNKTIYPTKIESSTGNKITFYKLSFELTVSNNENVELVLPEHVLGSSPPSLKFRLHDDTKYRLSPPTGCIQ